MGRLDGLDYDALRAEAEPYLRAYAADGGPSGPPEGPKGGQFALGGGRVGGKPKGRPARRPQGHGQQGSQHQATFGWDGRHGTGYGQKDGDPHVHDLQEAINLLGITDSHGQALKDDGKFGPRTDSAVKKLQKRLGMEQTGQVTQEFIDQVVRIAARVSRGRKPRRKPAAHRSADDEERDPARYGEANVADADRAAYGRVVLASDPWLRDRAGGILRDGLPELPLGDDDMVDALLVALAELDEAAELRAFNPAQKRIPKGQPGAGRFMSMVDRIKGAIEEHLKGKGDGHPLDDFTREQLRKVAKARGIELKRGEDRDSIAEKLLAHLKGGDGGSSKSAPKPAPKTPKPKAPRTPPKPAPMPVPDRAKPYHRNLDGLEDLARAVESGPKERTSLTGGVSAETELVMMRDGTKVVQKSGGFPDAEQASAMIAKAIGAPAPRVYRDERGSVYMDYVDDAKTWVQLKGAAIADGSVEAEQALTKRRLAAGESDDARLMGLLDIMIANSDRNDGNWMISDSGRVIPIDHGHAFPNAVIRSSGRIRVQNTGSRFSGHFFWDDAGRWKANDLTREDVAEMRRRLEALRPDFELLDRGRWLDYSLAVLDAVEPHANGTRNVVAGVR